MEHALRGWIGAVKDGLYWQAPTILNPGTGFLSSAQGPSRPPRRVNVFQK
jgi:hypothetical protein